MGRVYDKELKGFMELVKQSLVSKSHHDKKICNALLSNLHTLYGVVN